MKANKFKVHSVVQTHVGRVRKNNEDNFLFSGIKSNLGAQNESKFSNVEDSEFVFHALMDGMGGENGGEVASAMAVECFAECYVNLQKLRLPSNLVKARLPINIEKVSDKTKTLYSPKKSNQVETAIENKILSFLLKEIKLSDLNPMSWFKHSNPIIEPLHSQMSSISKKSSMEGQGEVSLNPTITNKIAVIQEYVQKANKAIYDKALTDSCYAKMGTTFTCLLLEQGSANVMHVGDSRVYLLRDSILTQLMVDHTETERMLRLGLLKKEEVKGHKSRFMLTLSMGISPEYGVLQADVSKTIPVQKDDLFLMCSDGLTDMVSDEDITEILLMNQSIENKSDRLIQIALDQGGKDNITVLLVEIAGK